MDWQCGCNLKYFRFDQYFCCCVHFYAITYSVKPSIEIQYKGLSQNKIRLADLKGIWKLQLFERHGWGWDQAPTIQWLSLSLEELSSRDNLRSFQWSTNSAALDGGVRAVFWLGESPAPRNGSSTWLVAFTRCSNVVGWDLPPSQNVFPLKVLFSNKSLCFFLKLVEKNVLCTNAFVHLGIIWIEYKIGKKQVKTTQPRSSHKSKSKSISFSELTVDT